MNWIDWNKIYLRSLKKLFSCSHKKWLVAIVFTIKSMLVIGKKKETNEWQESVFLSVKERMSIIISITCYDDNDDNNYYCNDGNNNG